MIWPVLVLQTILLLFLSLSHNSSLRSLREAIPLFDKKMHGFNDPDAILTAVESRSSCPVRIKRNELLETNIDYIYAAGEGSGYSGGITTSAIDGIKIALKIVNRE